MTYVRIPVPRFSAGLLSNLLGMIGLVLLVCAVGGLAGIWWALLTAGAIGVGLSYLISAQTAEVLPEIEVDEHGVTTRFHATK